MSPGDGGQPGPAGPRRPLSPATVMVIGLAAVGSAGLADRVLAAHQFTLALIYVPPLLALAWLAGWRFAAVCTVAAAAINFGVDAALGGSLANPLLLHAGNLALFVLCVPVERGVATARFMFETTRAGNAAKAANPPIRVGERVVLVPAWRREDAALMAARPDDVPVVLDPDQASEAGLQPANSLCVRLLEQYVRPGARVLHLGCGPGLLSLAALKLGASLALAADVDSEAVQATLANARLNDLSGKLEARLGAYDEVVAALVARGSEVFDIILSNVSTDQIAGGLKAGLALTLAPQGVLILSSFEPEHETRLRGRLDEAGLQVLERREQGGWVALAAGRKPGL